VPERIETSLFGFLLGLTPVSLLRLAAATSLTSCPSQGCRSIRAARTAHCAHAC
jgi:hypothetical protein